MGRGQEHAVVLAVQDRRDAPEWLRQWHRRLLRHWQCWLC